MNFSIALAACACACPAPQRARPKSWSHLERIRLCRASRRQSRCSALGVRPAAMLQVAESCGPCCGKEQSYGGKLRGGIGSTIDGRLCDGWKTGLGLENSRVVVAPGSRSAHSTWRGGRWRSRGGVSGVVVWW
eukprot:3388767-Prymnesium_polylepis.1